jgi:hypothetical protein
MELFKYFVLRVKRSYVDRRLFRAPKIEFIDVSFFPSTRVRHFSYVYGFAAAVTHGNTRSGKARR